MLKLSRQVPTRTKTLNILRCKKDFMPMTNQFREIRSRSREPLDTCYWCHHKFENGEMMALGIVEKRGNAVFCQTCADAMVEKGGGGEVR